MGGLNESRMQSPELVASTSCWQWQHQSRLKDGITYNLQRLLNPPLHEETWGILQPGWLKIDLYQIILYLSTRKDAWGILQPGWLKIDLYQIILYLSTRKDAGKYLPQALAPFSEFEPGDGLCWKAPSRAIRSTELKKIASERAWPALLAPGWVKSTATLPELGLGQATPWVPVLGCLRIVGLKGFMEMKCPIQSKH